MQTRHACPHGFGEIGEHKIAKHRVKIIAVIQRNIPKHALIAARGGGLVDAVHHLLQGVFNLTAVGGEIIVAKIFAGEVVKISNKFNCCHRACKLRAHGKHKIDKRAAKRCQMLRRTRFAAQFGQPIAQKGIHGYRHAIRFQAGFIVHINLVRFNLAHIFARQIVAK